MQVIRHTTATSQSTTTPYALKGMLLFAGTSAKLTDGAGRDVMGTPSVGVPVMFDGSPVIITGLISVGTFTDLYIYVE